MIPIKINNKIYKVKEAKSEEEREKGLQEVSKLPEDEGMLFYFDPPQKVSFWMKDTEISLDIVFIDEDEKVISVVQGNPNDETPIVEDNVAFVLEVNQNSGIKEGDELEFEDDEDEGPIMKVLAPDGSTQYFLWGGERIISRKETKILIKKAKKADLSKEDKDYKALGKYLFKVFGKQDSRNPEYVSLPEKKD